MSLWDTLTMLTLSSSFAGALAGFRIPATTHVGFPAVLILYGEAVLLALLATWVSWKLKGLTNYRLAYALKAAWLPASVLFAALVTSVTARSLV